MRRVFVIFLAGLWIAANASSAAAYYWLGALSGGAIVICADGISCARTVQNYFYGGGIGHYGGCSYEYGDGQLQAATCAGWIYDHVGLRPGLAYLVCEDDEIKTLAGCVKQAPPKPRCPAKAQPDSNGDPVDTASGMLFRNEVDFTTGGAHPLSFSRRYSSIVESLYGDARFAATRLGTNWRSNFDSALLDLGTHVAIVLPDGTALDFVRNDSGGYDQVTYQWSGARWAPGTNGSWAQLVKDTDNSLWHLTTADDTVWSYDFTSANHLVSIAYRGGYQQSLVYDGSGNNTAVNDNLGRSLVFTYSSTGLLSTMTTPDGNTYSYAYAGNYDPQFFNGVSTDDMQPQNFVLQSVTYPGSAPNPQVQYLYENTNFRSAMTGIIDERGVRINTWVYDANERIVVAEGAPGADRFTFAYDTTALTTTVTNALGKDTVYHFSPNSENQNLVTHVQGLPSSHCVGSDSYLAYDSNGYVTQTIDAEGRVRTIVPDGRGRPTSIVDAPSTPLQRTVSITWDPTFAIPDVVHQPGLDTSFTIDPATGRVASVTETDQTTQTVPYSTNGETRTWAFTYDSIGNLLTVDGPLPGGGDTVTYTYDANGYLATVTNQVGQVTTVNSVNGRGQPTRITDPNGTVTTLAYDDRGRLISMTVDAIGTPAATGFDYDLAGDVTKVTRPDASWLSFAYDGSRHVASITNNLGESILYNRDAMGNVTSITLKGTAVVAQRTQVFDELGRLMRSLGALGQTWSFAYDRTDNVVSTTDPRSKVYSFAFDALNRLSTETNPESAVVTLT